MSMQFCPCPPFGPGNRASQSPINRAFRKLFEVALLDQRGGVVDLVIGVKTRSARSLLWGLTLVGGCARAKPPDTDTKTAPEATMTNEKAAQTAAEAWLSLVDNSDYATSWTEAAVLFKRAVDQPGWEKALNGVRAPLGKMLSRTMMTAKYATTVPGAPDGEYVVIKFDTSFEKKKSAVKTVTPMKEPEGRWRVSGYYIK